MRIETAGGVLKLSAYLAGLLGLALATALVAYQGFSEVYQVLTAAGWGLVVVALFHLLPMTFDTLAWHAILHGPERPSVATLLWMRWIREAVDGLLPVAQVGGELVATRLLMLRGVPGALGGASLVLDVTLAVVTQLLFTLLGLGLLLLTTGDSGIVGGVLSGMLMGTIAVAGFILVQHRGLFGMLVRWLTGFAGGRRWLSLVGGAERLDAAVKDLYRRRSALTRAGVWQLLAWLVGAGEVWLALYFFGHPVTLVEALLLESVGQAVRSAAFAIPGALGIQEGGYMLLGAVLGLSSELGLALSLAKRVRALLLGVPALVTWQFIEGRRLWYGRVQRSDSS